jgi:hypothetical protein
MYPDIIPFKIQIFLRISITMEYQSVNMNLRSLEKAYHSQILQAFS